MNAVDVQNISLKMGAKYVLKDVSFKIKPGERWVVFGLNGSGKTTLLSIVAGYISPTEGNLQLFEQLPCEENICTLRQLIGWVSTSFYDRYLRYEGIMDIVLGGKSGTFCISDDEVTDTDVRKAKHFLTQLGLKRQMRYTYDMLSRGQKQKVLLARALMSECRLILLDEPCSGLDILSKAKVLYELEKLLQDEQKSLLYVAHHTDEIVHFFNKAMLLKNGSIHSQGMLGDVLTTANMTDFFGLPAEVIETDTAFHIQLHAEDIDLSRC